MDSGQFATLAYDPSDTETQDQNVAQDFDYITTLTDDELWYDH